MKVTPLVLVVLVLFLGGAGSVVWYLLKPSDEALVREAVTEMEAALSAPVRSNLPGQAENLAALKKHLGEQIRIELPNYHYAGTFERQEVLKDYILVRRHFQSIKVVCPDVAVSFPEGQEGIAFVTTTAHITLRGKEQKPLPVTLTLSNESGDWRIIGIAVPEDKKTPAQ